jgi:hypothetical protein
MGQACHALRGSEFSGSDLEFGVLNHKSQAPNYKSQININDRNSKFKTEWRDIQLLIEMFWLLGFVILILFVI